MIKLVDLVEQYRSIREEIDSAIACVLENAQFIGGTPVRQFEEEFSAFVGADHCVGCGNGTDALELAVQALGIAPGEEVLVPAHTWISTAEAVSNVGGKPVFVDTDPVTYTMDPVDAARRLSPHTRGIIPVHLYGHPSDMDSINDLAHRNGLWVLEDCAQSHAATYNGRNIGTLGDAAAFSFYPGKNLGAYGDAGCVVTSSSDIARRIRMLANHGQVKKHDHQTEGRNSRLDGIQAAVLRVKLKHLDRWTQMRRALASLYCELLRGARVKTPIERPGNRHVYHLFVVQVAERDRVRAGLLERGIETAIHYPCPLPLLKAYSGPGHKREQYPAVTGYVDRILSLPMYAELTASQCEFVCKTLTELSESA